MIRFVGHWVLPTEPIAFFAAGHSLKSAKPICVRPYLMGTPTRRHHHKVGPLAAAGPTPPPQKRGVPLEWKGQSQQLSPAVLRFGVGMQYLQAAFDEPLEQQLRVLAWSMKKVDATVEESF